MSSEQTLISAVESYSENWQVQMALACERSPIINGVDYSVRQEKPVLCFLQKYADNMNFEASGHGERDTGTTIAFPSIVGTYIKGRWNYRYHFVKTLDADHVLAASFCETANEPLIQYEESLGHFRRMFEGWQRIENLSVMCAEHHGEDSVSAWLIAHDINADIEKRLASLWELANEDEQGVARFVVEQLRNNELPDKWRNNLILLGEHIQFEDDEMREEIRDRLRQLALSLRCSAHAGIRPVVLSAVRTYSSMIQPSDAGNLLPLLEPPKPIETRLVTLQCIAHLFEREPFEQNGHLKQLADRVNELAEKFLDVDLLVAGEKAAIGQNATHALAALGDERLRDRIEKIKTLQMNWLTRQMIQKLDALLIGWQNTSGLKEHPAFQLVEEQQAKLRE